MVEQLDNQKLIKQCKRIKDLILKVARTEAGQKIYGAKYHNYQLTPPVPLEEVRKFEKKHNVTLPVEYVYFITLVGRSGAGPGNGFMYGFPEALKTYEKELMYSSEQLSCMISDEEWEEKYGEGALDLPDLSEENDLSREAGTFVLTAMDTIFLAHLIVTGKQAGNVVYLDWEQEYPPIWPKSSSNFLDWCENWFKEILAGYEVHPGNFMYYEIGTEEDLIQSFYNHEDEKYKKGVLHSFFKFSSISESTIEFLNKNRHLDDKVVSYIFKKFGVGNL